MRPFPIGIDDFRKLRENDYYYADKTMFIKELLDNRGEVSLFTRPRRFGKTLGISMLKYFFEDECGARENRYLFEGLEIMEAGEKYLKHMGKYPVISLSMKTSKQPSFKMAYECLQDEIAQEFDRHSLVLVSDKLNEAEKKQYREMMNKQGPDSVWAKALDFLSRCLKVYQQNVIILLDSMMFRWKMHIYVDFTKK
ncbi:MAG: AAA family ATPase [Eisenbergiella massiliensis]